MLVNRGDNGSIVVSSSSSSQIEMVKSACDGKKVRGVNRVIIPIESIAKLSIAAPLSQIKFEDDTFDVYNHIIAATKQREINVEKIRSQYNGVVKFDYDYKGSYSTIMKHQKILYNLMVYTNGCALLADPGLGKTGPSLWGIDKKIEQGKVKRALYITLSSLKDNVMAEIAKEIPHRTCVVLKGAAHADKVINKKYKSDKKNLDYDIYISNYESMTGIVQMFDGSFFDMVVLDEVQRIGSATSNQTKSILSAFEGTKYKYVLTGTLNANNLMSFFNPFRFMGADYIPYANYYTFRREYMFTVDKEERIWKPKAGAVAYVGKLIGRNSVTFKVDECLDMPSVKYNRMSCSLDGDQLKAYVKAKEDMVADIEGLCLFCEHLDVCELYKERKGGGDTSELPCINPGAIIDSALILARKLHQIASGFYINSWTEVDDDGKEERKQEIFDFKSNPKHKLIMDTIDTIPDGEKVLIMGSYTHSIEFLAEALRKKYGSSAVISCYGSDNAFEAVEEFKKDGKRFLIGNQTKLGTGLNIQFSRYMMFIQNSFSFVQREQSVGRQWRKGQTGTVMVYDFVTAGSIDEHVMDVLEDKKDLSLSLEQWSKILH